MAESTQIKRTTKNTNTLTWALGALTSIATFFAAYNRQMWNDSEAKNAANVLYYQKQLSIMDEKLEQKDRALDSVQGLMLKRADNSFEEWKRMLAIDSNRKSTIIIKTNK
ncbi:hypothetical protein G7074_18240 [Pedobacter sp. HDW13]|uniref:hypothetical protein n=1 Tax=Pedobacter sp. HDW13 TaxID=2714940 RepID=UPI00140DE4FB|nr:hypothetical protein [Pedobacter sp. HDW13]QIL41034.1 hypothetical protein G7074_18240 [Pedobacter sp. HDW13]